MSNGKYAADRSPALAVAFISIVVSVAMFWTLFVVRDASLPATPWKLVPFALAGLGNPAAFRLLYFMSVDRLGARVSAAVVSANPAVAAILALPVLGEQFTVRSALGLLGIVAGAVVLQAARAGDDGRDGYDDLLVEERTRLELRGLAYPLAGFVVLFGVSRSARRQVRVRDRLALVAFTLAGVFVAANWLAWFSTLQLGTVVTVVPLANVFPLFIVAVSYALVRQVPTSPRVIGGIAVIVAGATLMQLG
jgi:uncharacterized membrane protein